MKTKSKFFISAAVVLLLAMALATSVFAAAVQPAISVDNASPNPGDSVTFTITTNNLALMGNVTASANLEFVSVSADNSDSAGFIAMASSVVYVYRVKTDAQPGEAFSLTVTGLIGTDEAIEEEFTYSDIAAGGTIAGTPASSSVPTSDSPSSTPTPETPAAPAPATTPTAPRTGVYK